MRKLMLVLLAIAIPAVLFMGCSPRDDNPAGPGPTPTAVVQTYSITYTVTADTVDHLQISYTGASTSTISEEVSSDGANNISWTKTVSVPKTQLVLYVDYPGGTNPTANLLQAHVSNAEIDVNTHPKSSVNGTAAVQTAGHYLGHFTADYNIP